MVYDYLKAKRDRLGVKVYADSIGYDVVCSRQDYNLGLYLKDSVSVNQSYVCGESRKARVTPYDMRMVLGVKDIELYSAPVWRMVVAHEWVHVLLPVSWLGLDQYAGLPQRQWPHEVTADRIAEEVTGMEREDYERESMFPVYRGQRRNKNGNRES
jgi:hypothetical protein